MGGTDKYCFLSGAGLIDVDSFVEDLELWGEEAESDSITENAEEDDDAEDDGDGFNDILTFDEADVEAAQDLMLLCPCRRNDSGEIIEVVTDPEAEDPEIITKDTVTALFDVKASDMPELGAYEHHREGQEIEDLQVWSSLGPTFLCCYASFVITRAAAPQMGLHHWYDIIFHSNGPGHIAQRAWLDGGPFAKNALSETKSAVLDQDCYYYDGPEWVEVADTGYGAPSFINYGPIARTISQYAVLKDVGTHGAKTYSRLRKRTHLSPEEKRREVWLGEGNLWTFAAPNRFPIAQALAAPPFFSFDNEPTAQRDLTTFSFGKLPPDVLEEMGQYLHPQGLFFLLQVDRSTRAALLPRIHSIAFKSIAAHTPHLFPAGPFVLDEGKRGREEVDYWVAEWAKGGYDLSQGDDWKASQDVHRIPWLVYAKEATKSPNMRNRRRIWGVALQFVKVYGALSKAREERPEDFIPFQ